MVCTEKVGGQKDAPRLLQEAAVELVLDGGHADVENILLFRRKDFGQHTIVTTLGENQTETQRTNLHCI